MVFDTSILVPSAANAAVPIDTQSGHADSVQSLSFDPTSCLLASGSIDQTVRVWKAGPQGLRGIRLLDDHCDTVLCVSVCGDMVLSGAADGQVLLWDIRAPLSPVWAAEPDSPRPVQHCQLSSRGRLILVDDGLDAAIQLVDLRNPSLRTEAKQDWGTATPIASIRSSQRKAVTCALSDGYRYVVAGMVDADSYRAGEKKSGVLSLLDLHESRESHAWKLGVYPSRVSAWPSGVEGDMLKSSPQSGVMIAPDDTTAMVVMGHEGDLEVIH